MRDSAQCTKYKSASPQIVSALVQNETFMELVQCQLMVAMIKGDQPEITKDARLSLNVALEAE